MALVKRHERADAGYSACRHAMRAVYQMLVSLPVRPLSSVTIERPLSAQVSTYATEISISFISPSLLPTGLTSYTPTEITATQKKALQAVVTRHFAEQLARSVLSVDFLACCPIGDQ